MEALRTSPESFDSSYEEEVKLTEIDLKNFLLKSDVFGVFIGNKLVSSTVFDSYIEIKKRHLGIISGVYTKKGYRCQGFASALIKAVINYSKSFVVQLELTCTTDNFNALALYDKLGFKIYGTKPRALKTSCGFSDDHLMFFDLQQRQ